MNLPTQSYPALRTGRRLSPRACAARYGVTLLQDAEAYGEYGDTEGDEEDETSDAGEGEA